MKTIYIDSLTYEQPFCAGVIIMQEGHLVATINESSSGEGYRIGGVGGGQEIGETPLICAKREALEEIGTTVNVKSAPATYLHDLDTGNIEQVQCVKEPAPLLVQFKKNSDPHTPYKPGLPCGPYTHYVMYMAETGGERLTPSKEVKGLVLVKPAEWKVLEQGLTIEQLKETGMKIIETEILRCGEHVFVHEYESLRTAVRLMCEKDHL